MCIVSWVSTCTATTWSSRGFCLSDDSQERRSAHGVVLDHGPALGDAVRSPPDEAELGAGVGPRLAGRLAVHAHVLARRPATRPRSSRCSSRACSDERDGAADRDGDAQADADLRERRDPAQRVDPGQHPAHGDARREDEEPDQHQGEDHTRCIGAGGPNLQRSSTVSRTCRTSPTSAALARADGLLDRQRVPGVAREDRRPPDDRTDLDLDPQGAEPAGRRAGEVEDLVGDLGGDADEGPRLGARGPAPQRGVELVGHARQPRDVARRRRPPSSARDAHARASGRRCAGGTRSVFGLRNSAAAASRVVRPPAEHAGDLQLLRREVVEAGGAAALRRLAGRAQLGGGPVGPRHRAEPLERRERRAQRRAGVDPPLEPAQAGAVGELGPGRLERVRGVLVVGQRDREADVDVVVGAGQAGGPGGAGERPRLSLDLGALR